MNNPTLGLCCGAMIGRADIEESFALAGQHHWHLPVRQMTGIHVTELKYFPLHRLFTTGKE
jgi:hypothetical protein